MPISAYGIFPPSRGETDRVKYTTLEEALSDKFKNYKSILEEQDDSKTELLRLMEKRFADFCLEGNGGEILQ